MIHFDTSALCSEWIANDGKYCEAWDKIDELVRDEPRTAFQVIANIQYRITSSDKPDYELLRLLAASHLEDVLSERGDEIIEDVEHLATNGAEFRKCLSGVWQREMTDELYAGVQKSADPNFKFA